MIRGAVFDMDGLMFDTERLVYENWLEAMTARGYAYDIELFKQTVGRRKKEVELFYRERYGADFPYRELADGCRARYISRVESEGVPVKRGLYELLEWLKGKGVKIALATSTSSQTAKINLDSAGVTDYFDALVCGGDVKNGKPHPEVFLKAAKKLGLEPGECAAFEDSINGIKSAFSAGMITVMVPDLIEPAPQILPMVSYLCQSLDKSIEFLERHIDKAYNKD